MESVLNKAGKKLFEKHLEQYTPVDPLYETYTTDKGKQKRRKRALPPGLSKRDARILRTLMSRAHHLDKGFSLLGLRFGYTFIVGFIPVVGDFADIGLNYLLIVRPAQKLDLPGWLLRRMLLNNAVSASVGLVPFVGDVVLAAYKANSRNVALLEEFLRIRGEEFIKMGGVVEEEDERGGLFGFGKRKGRKDKTYAPPPANKNDVEQVKPGAGMTGPELKNSLADVPPPQVGSNWRKSKPKNGLASSTAAVAPSSKRVTEPGHSSGSGSGSSGFSFFNSRSRKSKPSPVNATALEALPASRGRTGRFVENVAQSPDGLSPP